MRYWGAEESVTKRMRAQTRRSKGSKRKLRGKKQDAPASIASGGSVKPFLRRVYQHQVMVSGPVQRVLLFLIIAGLLYAFVLGDSGVLRIAMLRHERSQLDGRIAELQRNTEQLATEIHRLESDAFFIEKAGRERYGYVRPDEQVYKIVTGEERPEPKAQK